MQVSHTGRAICNVIENISFLVYPYQSAEAGDLQFDAGENVLVVKKDGDWWTGVIGNRTGIFPANYVQPADEVNKASSVTNDFNSMSLNGAQPAAESVSHMTAEEARNQADADSEVSQINTQIVSNDSRTEERGMTASAVRIHANDVSVDLKIIFCYLTNRVSEQRKVKWQQSLHRTRLPAASSCLCKKVSSL